MASMLVLDFGGVITRTLFETHDQTERALGLAPGTLNWRGPFDPENDILWQKMQAQDISERDYWLIRTQETGALLGKNWNAMQDLVKAARSAEPMAAIRPEFLEALDESVKAGKRLAILSNELDLFYGKDFRSGLPFLEKFELIVDATYTKVLKPDQKAYAMITKQAGLPPQECVFVDDQLRNIKGAQAFGMQTVHFDVTEPRKSYEQVLTQLL